MQLLDAAIAFTLTIAGFATVVSIIIEIIHRALSLRSKGLQAMLEQHFNDVIKPTIESRLEQKLKAGGRKLEAELTRLRTELIDKMTANPLKILQDMSWMPKRVVNAISKYNEVTALDFIKRLPETEVYELIELPGEGTIIDRLDKFDRKYQEYEKAISNYFKRRAQVLSFIVGIALALIGRAREIGVSHRAVGVRAGTGSDDQFRSLCRLGVLAAAEVVGAAP